MDLQLSQNNYNEGDRLQTSENLSGFFSRMTVSNKTMERIMRQDSNLSPYDGFRIGGIGKVLNQIGLNQRKHHIIYKVSSGEFAIPMEFTGNVMEIQLISKEEILEELSRLREEVAVTMKWIHIGTIKVVIKATFKEGIDSEIHLSIMDRRINNLRDDCLGTMIGNLYARKLIFDIHPRIAYNLADQDFSKVLTLHQDFKRNDLMEEGNRPYSITYRITYAISNTHHSDLFLRKEYIEIPRIFKEFAKVMAPDRIRIPRIGGVDIVIKDHPILDRTLSSRTEFSSRMSFSEDRIMGYKERERIVKSFNSSRDKGIAGRENGSMTLGLSFLEDHKPWKKKRLINSDNFYEESEEEIKNLKEVLQELKAMDISEENKLSLENIKRLIQRNFSENPLAWWDKNKIEATLKVKEECKYEYVRYKPIQMNMKDKKDMQMIIKEHINLGLIEPGISAYSSPGFLKGFWPLLKETETAKWKWEEIHTQRVCELKQVCNNLPKLAIPQDENELELNKKFGRQSLNAQVAGQIQRADVATVQTAIRTTMVASTSLWNDLQEPIQKASSSEMTNELREHDPKYAFRVQDSRLVAANLSTACTRP
ncbi:movement protein [Sesamum angolense]|uniref:Movement protein n=1 Tax=Sesamum angolense TaxID=2727404 RepID=A0AAE1W7J3_9LAMI|nr:movement protein [Sesamum angolense]